MAKPEWQVGAILDVDSIADFLARRSPAYASAFVRRVRAAAEQLEDFPRRGRVLPEMEEEGRTDIRELIFQNYRIVYQLVGDRIFIVGVWHGALNVRRRVRDRSWDIT